MKRHTVAVAALIAAGVATLRFNRRPSRLVVLDAAAIVEAEARRISRDRHPSTWGQR